MASPVPSEQQKDPHWISWVTSEAARELLYPQNKAKLREVREHVYASSDEPVVVAFVEKGKLADPRSEVTELLSRPLLDALEERGLVGYLRSLKDVIRRYYSIKSGRYDEIPHCIVEWDLSVLPLFIEFRFTFDNEERTKPFLVHVDCMKDDDIESTINLGRMLVKEIRENNRVDVEKEVQNLIAQQPALSGLFESQESEVLTSLAKISLQNKARNSTKTKYADLLEIQDDPLLEYGRWFTQLQDLAISVNACEADLSLFKNLERLAAFRKNIWEDSGRTEITLKPETDSKRRRSSKSNKKRAGKSGGAKGLNEPLLDSNPAIMRISSDLTAIAFDCSILALPADACSVEAAGSICILDSASHPPGTATVLQVPSPIRPASVKSDPTERPRSPTPSMSDCDWPSITISGDDSLHTAERFSSLRDKSVSFGSESSTGSVVRMTRPRVDVLEDLSPFPNLLATLAPEKRCHSAEPRLKICPDSITHPDLSTDPHSIPSHGQVLGKDDMSDAEAAPQASPHQSHYPGEPKDRDPPAYQDWAHDQSWVYYSEGLIDGRLLSPGVKPFLKPPGWLPHKRSWPLLHVVTLQARTTGQQPLIRYDPVCNRLVITPHAEPLADVRQFELHPDWLPTEKLVEYQAVEMSGHVVWRHDRNYLPCALPTCTKTCRDNDHSTQLCLGCGPRSFIRYCSRKHQHEDLGEHWDECRNSGTILQHYVDIDSQPARFHRRYPAIDDVSDLRSYEKHRQRLYYIWNRGQYTLFREGWQPWKVRWPNFAPHQKYGPRVERLMNAAFFDQAQDNIVEYLFYLVRMALRSWGRYTPGIAKVLHNQFSAEFDWDSRAGRDEDPCECRWLGAEADERKCDAHCATFHARLGLMGHRSGIKRLLEALESKYWILRVWQRQHPTVTCWRRRLAGDGFPRVRLRNLDEERPCMGQGWMGFGASNVFGGWEYVQ